MTDYLSVFVTPHRPEMEEVVKKAADRHPYLSIVGTGNFKDALEVGNNRYQKAIQQGFAQRPLFDSNGFLRIVDVTACRKKGINPLM